MALLSRAPAATESAVLFRRWRRFSDRAARDELIARYLPLARKLARRYMTSSEPYDDLVQVASLGLVDRKSTRLNSSHSSISYAVFCLKKKKKKKTTHISLH